MNPSPISERSIAFPKNCHCGRSWSLAAWLTLPFVGTMDYHDGEALELRHCTCGSTIAMLSSAVSTAR